MIGHSIRILRIGVAFLGRGQRRDALDAVKQHPIDAVNQYLILLLPLFIARV